MESMQSIPEESIPASMVPSGQDRFGQVRDFGISRMAFKVTHAESGGMLIVENMLHTKGGPARHFHHNQDEWFFIREGQFILEIAGNRYVAKAGDSFWGPRGTPHAWACTSEVGGSILFAFNPPGKMEAFFDVLAKLNSFAPPDPALWLSHGMTLVGPPLEM